MVQEIATYIIIAAAVGYAVVQFVKNLRGGGRNGNCKCGCGCGR
ncbi:MAG: FeoB-associated Cys-rich membrane protein [Bacteroidales bacterium]|nr:FeoB-associated Cys-rich membrane protein [Bacteroidales bacterium]